MSTKSRRWEAWIMLILCGFIAAAGLVAAWGCTCHCRSRSWRPSPSRIFSLGWFVGTGECSVPAQKNRGRWTTYRAREGMDSVALHR